MNLRLLKVLCYYTLLLVYEIKCSYVIIPYDLTIDNNIIRKTFNFSVISRTYELDVLNHCEFEKINKISCYNLLQYVNYTYYQRIGDDEASHLINSDDIKLSINIHDIFNKIKLLISGNKSNAIIIIQYVHINDYELNQLRHILNFIKSSKISNYILSILIISYGDQLDIAIFNSYQSSMNIYYSYHNIKINYVNNYTINIIKNFTDYMNNNVDFYFYNILFINLYNEYALQKDLLFIQWLIDSYDEGTSLLNSTVFDIIGIYYYNSPKQMYLDSFWFSSNYISENYVMSSDSQDFKSYEYVSTWILSIFRPRVYLLIDYFKIKYSDDLTHDMFPIDLQSCIAIEIP